MRRHIVRAFDIMAVIGDVLINRFIEIHLKILPNGGVGILIYGKRGGGMLDKNLANTSRQLADLRQGQCNF